MVEFWILSGFVTILIFGIAIRVSYLVGRETAIDEMHRKGG